MILRDLITFLEAHDPSIVCPVGFYEPHSYRGYYEDLAFVPAEHVTVGAMLESARSALGRTFQGWKGGEYTMGEWTEVHLAERGSTGEGIGSVLLRYMVGEL